MGVDLAGLWRQADEYLRRHIKSKAVREAEKRRAERQSQEAARRVKRAAVVGGASGAGLLGYGLLIAPLAGPALIAAGGGALLLVAVSLALPSRRRTGGDFSQAELAALPGEAEDWLLGRRDGLPLAVRPLLDRIFGRLGDLQPHLAALAPHSGPAWEARRLLGDHLPRLVLAYEAIPPSARHEDPAVEERLAAGLRTIADALDELCREICRDPLMSFETQGRFLETRYRGQNLPSNRFE
ncbi:MAG TPA: hypothetical protein VEA60_04925 [Allosphingosinicella sp.]|nr:hypothetical protein [Allosphingosinicella sp.]